MASAITPLANITLTSSASTVTFSSISAGYRDLFIVVQGSAASPSNMLIKFNGDTTSGNYFGVSMTGIGGSPSSYSYTGNYLSYGTYWDTGQNLMILNILDFAATDKHKSYLVRDNSVGNGVEAVAGRWANTGAITSVAIMGSANFSAGTSFTLYGVSA